MTAQLITTTKDKARLGPESRQTDALPARARALGG